MKCVAQQLTTVMPVTMLAFIGVTGSWKVVDVDDVSGLVGFIA